MARAEWSQRCREIDTESLIFLDESGITTDMARLWGRIEGSLRLPDAVPAGRWRTLTLLGAISSVGWVATMTVEAPTDGDVFLAYLDHVLCPQLRPGHWVVMDNLAAHKVEGVRERIEATGARLLYLPPYSPDFNPTEKCWAQLKQHLRALKARSVATLEPAIAAALQARTKPKPTSATAAMLYANCENVLGTWRLKDAWRAALNNNSREFSGGSPGGIRTCM